MGRRNQQNPERHDGGVQGPPIAPNPWKLWNLEAPNVEASLQKGFFFARQQTCMTLHCRRQHSLWFSLFVSCDSLICCKTTSSSILLPILTLVKFDLGCSSSPTHLISRPTFFVASHFASHTLPAKISKCGSNVFCCLAASSYLLLHRLHKPEQITMGSIGTSSRYLSLRRIVTPYAPYLTR